MYTPANTGNRGRALMETTTTTTTQNKTKEKTKTETKTEKKTNKKQTNEHLRKHHTYNRGPTHFNWVLLEKLHVPSKRGIFSLCNLCLPRIYLELWTSAVAARLQLTSSRC